MRLVPTDSTATRPASRSTRRCWETFGRVIVGRWSASWLTDSGRCDTRARITRRVGSARATQASMLTYVRYDLRRPRRKSKVGTDRAVEVEHDPERVAVAVDRELAVVLRHRQLRHPEDHLRPGG